MLTPTKDKLMRLTHLSSSSRPQTLAWLAMHTCYSSEPVDACNPPEETEAGLSVVRHLLAGNRGHYSPLEQPYLSVCAAYVPHSVVQQWRTHRHQSFSVQSFRYTSRQFISYATEEAEVNTERLQKLFYLGRSPSYSDYVEAHKACLRYQQDVAERGQEPEEARGRLFFDVRQHAVVGGNLRAWWHLLDLRLKPDTQPEFQQLMLQLQELLRAWTPQLQEWYDSKRATRAVLSP